MTSLYINGNEYINDLKVILFDKDGTLIDVHHYWSSMISIRASEIKRKWFNKHKDQEVIYSKLISGMGVDEKTGRMKPEGPVGVKSRGFIVSLVASIINSNNVSVTEQDVENLFVDVDEQTSNDLLPLLRLLPGVSELLNQLTNKSVISAIVSTDITSRARKAMDALGITHHFFEIVGGDQVDNTKPAPDLAQIVLQQCNYDKGKIAVIGDHPVDMQMGLNAGINTNIAVLTGLSDRSAFEKINCEVINDLTEIQIC